MAAPPSHAELSTARAARWACSSSCPQPQSPLIWLAPGSLAYKAAMCACAFALVGWHPAVDPSASLMTAHSEAAHLPPPLTMCHGTAQPAMEGVGGELFGGNSRSNSAN